jgi:hypothetical protein
MTGAHVINFVAGTESLNVPTRRASKGLTDHNLWFKHAVTVTALSLMYSICDVDFQSDMNIILS